MSEREHERSVIMLPYIFGLHEGVGCQWYCLDRQGKVHVWALGRWHEMPRERGLEVWHRHTYRRRGYKV
jgi:hypothetical protein